MSTATPPQAASPQPASPQTASPQGPPTQRSLPGVVGVGVDVVHVPDFVEQVERPGSEFVRRTFTVGERSDVTVARDGTTGLDARRLATRFAAKEAFVKAWSSSRFGSPPALDRWDPLEIEVVGDLEGRPALLVTGTIAGSVGDDLGPGWRAHLSLSHDGPTAAAFVVLSAGVGS